MRLHVALVDNATQVFAALLSFIFLKFEALHEKSTLLEPLNFQSFAGLGIEVAQIEENIAVEAHGTQLLNRGVDTQLLDRLFAGFLAEEEWAEFHARVQIKEYLVVSEDGMAWNQDGGLI